jgi:hypothetical protein
MSPKPKMSPSPPKMSSKSAKIVGSNPAARRRHAGVAEAVVARALVGSASTA